MEIGVEVNKYFADEMAKQIIGKISDEELLQKARSAWNDINKGQQWNDSMLQKAVNSVYLNAILDRVNALVQSEAYQKQINEDAVNVVDEILKKAREKMIEEVSTRMAVGATGYGGIDLKGYIQSVIAQTVNY